MHKWDARRGHHPHGADRTTRSIDCELSAKSKLVVTVSRLRT